VYWVYEVVQYRLYDGATKLYEFVSLLNGVLTCVPGWREISRDSGHRAGISRLIQFLAHRACSTDFLVLFSFCLWIALSVGFALINYGPKAISSFLEVSQEHLIVAEDRSRSSRPHSSQVTDPLFRSPFKVSLVSRFLSGLTLY